MLTCCFLTIAFYVNSEILLYELYNACQLFCKYLAKTMSWDNFPTQETVSFTFPLLPPFRCNWWFKLQFFSWETAV